MRMQCGHPAADINDKKRNLLEENDAYYYHNDDGGGRSGENKLLVLFCLPGKRKLINHKD